MRLLDLFCGAGGAAMGYSRAGFDEIVGVDVVEQPHYPFTFVRADAMTYPLEGFDAIHASPPCKAFNVGRNMWAGRLPDDRHADLLTPTRARLLEQPAPWIVENVPGAPMRRDLVLCGSQFGLGVRRHRWFELSWPYFALLPPCSHPREAIVSVFGGGALGPTPRGGRSADGRHTTMQSRRHVSHDVASAAMGIDWMGRDELSLAVPPAYTEHIGHQLLMHLGAAA